MNTWKEDITLQALKPYGFGEKNRPWMEMSKNCHGEERG